MKIYLVDYYDHKIFLFDAVDDKDAFRKMNEYLESKNFKSYYMRMWNENGGTMVDFGSHSKFFFIERDDV